jgi:hypothetical protein
MPTPIKSDNDVSLILSAVRALTGQVPSSLISVSVEQNDNTLHWKCIFDKKAPEKDLELLSAAAAEFISDFNDCQLQESIVRMQEGEVPELLRNLVYLRYEAPE